MTENKRIDIMVGVKAEQSLRELVRQLMDTSDDAQVELAPVGKKDWIAGVRVGSELSLNDLNDRCKEIHRILMDIGSDQRIRFESIKLFSLQPPVPVFKQDDDSPADAANETEEPAAAPAEDAPADTTPVCPVCKRKVNEYNLHYNTEGKVVGCFMCGGNAVY